MATFDVITYLSGLTTFVLDKAVLERIALERGVSDVTDYMELDQKTKDLLLADVYYVIYTSPNTSASYSASHGTYKESVGSQTINDKASIYNVMIGLYRKWGEEDKIELLTDSTACNIDFIDATGITNGI